LNLQLQTTLAGWIERLEMAKERGGSFQTPRPDRHRVD
jgi:hypothetical protein